MNLSLSVIGAVALVLVVAVAVYLLFRDFISGTQDTQAFFEIRRPSFTDAVVADPRPMLDRKSTRLNSSHVSESRMPSSA